MQYSIQADTTMNAKKIYNGDQLIAYHFFSSGRTTVGWMLGDIETKAKASYLKVDPQKTQDYGGIYFNINNAEFNPDEFEAKILELAKLYQVNLVSIIINN
jgi:hypothetical protein